jgi:ribosomal protein S18 acetylase RimI-like enzyme
MNTLFTIDTAALKLSAFETPWDSAVYGETVVSIESIEVFKPRKASYDFKSFSDWLDGNRVGLVSCRLSHQKLRESMFLESQDFRFVEMVLHPYLNELQSTHLTPPDLDIQEATPEDLPDLIAIAGSAFSNERFHIDPRVLSEVGDKRYENWVRNCPKYLAQTLFTISDQRKTVGFFLTKETSAPNSVEWLLTGISPKLQGLGYGKRSWLAMLHLHQTRGVETICTTVSARNSRVLNLYSQLKFRFKDPEMTFHWVREVP